MRDRSGALPTEHTPRAWDDEDNKPVVPRIPGPRKPSGSTR